jgi:hypothetical protein
MFDLVSSAAKRDPKISVPESSALALSILDSDRCPRAVPSPLPSDGRGEGQGEVRVLNDGQPMRLHGRPSTQPLPPPKPARFSWDGSSGKKGRNCETNPISFKTCCPSNTNNEKISLLTKSKSYDGANRAHGLSSRLLKPGQGYSRLLKPK